MIDIGILLYIFLLLVFFSKGFCCDQEQINDFDRQINKTINFALQNPDQPNFASILLGRLRYRLEQILPQLTSRV